MATGGDDSWQRVCGWQEALGRARLKLDGMVQQTLLQSSNRTAEMYNGVQRAQEMSSFMAQQGGSCQQACGLGVSNHCLSSPFASLARYLYPETDPQAPPGLIPQVQIQMQLANQNPLVGPPLSPAPVGGLYEDHGNATRPNFLTPVAVAAPVPPQAPAAHVPWSAVLQHQYGQRTLQAAAQVLLQRWMTHQAHQSPKSYSNGGKRRRPSPLKAPRLVAPSEMLLLLRRQLRREHARRWQWRRPTGRKARNAWGSWSASTSGWMQRRHQRSAPLWKRTRALSWTWSRGHQAGAMI